MLDSLTGITDDVIVYDNGSTDHTVEKVRHYPVHLHQGNWEGFGRTKRKANSLAKYDWILSLDADESLSDELKQSIKQLTLDDERVVYDIPFHNYLGNQHLRYGEWGGDHHIRLFNRKVANWDDSPVHEKLVYASDISVRKLKGAIIHQTMRDLNDYVRKMTGYAMLNAVKYFQQGRKASWFRIHMSPGFTFFNYYFLKLGFLDGHAGYLCAKMGLPSARRTPMLSAMSAGPSNPTRSSSCM